MLALAAWTKQGLEVQRCMCRHLLHGSPCREASAQGAGGFRSRARPAAGQGHPCTCCGGYRAGELAPWLLGTCGPIALRSHVQNKSQSQFVRGVSTQSVLLPWASDSVDHAEEPSLSS